MGNTVLNDTNHDVSKSSSQQCIKHYQ